MRAVSRLHPASRAVLLAFGLSKFV